MTRSPARTRLYVICLAILGGLGIGISAYFMAGAGGLTRIVEPNIGGPFRLIDDTGKLRTEQDFRGKIMMVEFGYTFCPDICPLDLQLFADVMNKLGADADNVRPIFITVDPGRDTPQQLHIFVKHFSPTIIGLTGSEQEIAKVAQEYRVYYKLAADHKTNPNYSVDHSAFLYLMDQKGRYFGHFTRDTPVDSVVAAIRKHLAPASSSSPSS